MILTVILTALVTALVVVVGLYGAYRYEKHRIYSKIHAYFTAADDKTPSPFAQAVDVVALVFAQRFTDNIKTTVMGMNSVDSRLDAKEAREAIATGNPKLGLLMNFLPKRLLKNPALIAAAAKILGKVGGNGKHLSGAPGSMSAPSIFQM